MITKRAYRAHSSGKAAPISRVGVESRSFFSNEAGDIGVYTRKHVTRHQSVIHLRCPMNLPRVLSRRRHLLPTHENLPAGSAVQRGHEADEAGPHKYPASAHRILAQKPPCPAGN